MTVSIMKKRHLDDILEDSFGFSLHQDFWADAALGIMPMLSEREKHILRHMYGLMDGVKRSDSEVQRDTGATQEEVEKLKFLVSKYLADAADSNRQWTVVRAFPDAIYGDVILCLQEFDEVNQEILKRKFGFFDGEQWECGQLASFFNVSTQSVKLIVKRAERLIKKNLALEEM